MVGLVTSVVTLSVAIVGHILTKSYEYPWLAMNTTQCSNGSYHFINNSTTNVISTTTVASLESDSSFPFTTSQQQMNEEEEPNWFFGLSFNYYPMFSMICCLTVSITVSLLSIAIAKIKPSARYPKWFLPPKDIKPCLMRLPQRSQ